MDSLVVFERLGIALGLGLLVGLQRERVKSPLAGIRTFALITLFGAVSGLVVPYAGAWTVGFGAAAVAAILIAGNFFRPRPAEQDPGVTTEIAGLLMYGVGVFVVVGDAAPAIAVGGAVALLLHFKEPMHAFVARIGEADLKAIMQFVLITLVILPVLPNRTFGPFDVLNPRQIWWMVVLIVGISLGGYIAFKLFGQKGGAVLSGLLGGTISSTATTVSYARRTRETAAGVHAAALVVVISSGVSVLRIMVELAVVAPSYRLELLPPMGVMLGGFALLSVAAYLLVGDRASELPQPGNPAELRIGLVFAGVYSLVLVAVAATKTYIGESGLYAVGVLSGVADMDAITLSTGRLVEAGRVDSSVGWRVVLVASLANLLFKGGVVALLGHPQLLRWIGGAYLAAILLGLGVLLCWP